MTLKGEKNAWLVILVCTAAIAVLLLLSGGRSKNRAQFRSLNFTSMSSRLPASVRVGAGPSSMSATPELVVIGSNPGRVRNMTIVKASVDSDTAEAIRERESQIKSNKKAVELKDEESRLRNFLLELQPESLSARNEPNAWLSRRLMIYNENLIAAQQVIRSTDELLPPVENGGEESAEHIEDRELRVALLYTSDAQRAAGGTEAVKDEIIGRFSDMYIFLQTQLGYRTTSFWVVGKYNGSGSNDNIRSAQETADMILIYDGKETRSFVQYSQ